MGQYVLAIDQGTTGTTAVLINTDDFSVIDKINQEYPQIYPHPGWVEHNLNDIWTSVKETTQAILTKNSIDPKNISCIGITNQRETTCAFAPSGEPLANAIVWQDRRTSPLCDSLKKSGKSDLIRNKTGLPIDPYFSATKMQWLLSNNPSFQELANNKKLLFGTIDTYLLYRLTSGHSYYTEPSNASRTLLMDLRSCQWDQELLSIFGIAEESLPKIVDSISHFGETTGLDFLPDGIPITGILGDQQAALFGQGVFQQGGIKCTYGTGAFVLLNTGETPSFSDAGLLTTVAYKYNNKTSYALEGSSYIAGGAVQWLRDNLSIIENSHQVEELASSVGSFDEMEHLLFLPFFTGLGSPYWKSSAKAAILGITRDTDKRHLALACLNGIAFSINDLVQSFKKDINFELSALKVDGGASANNLLMQIQSDLSNLDIIRPRVIETTALGAALAAAIGSNLLKTDQISNYWKQDACFNTNKNHAEFYQRKYSQWEDAIKRLFL